MLGQDNNPSTKFEILSSVAFSYSNTNDDYPLTNQISNEHTYSITALPTLGYSINEQIELLLDLRYTYTYFYSGTITNGYEDWNQLWTHKIGFRAGILYNLRLNSFISPFCGTKCGLNWTRSIYGGRASYNNIETPWGKQVTSFPDFIVGTRFRLTDNSAFLLSLEYEKTATYHYFPNTTSDNESIVFGFGFVVVL